MWLFISFHDWEGNHAFPQSTRMLSRIPFLFCILELVSRLVMPKTKLLKFSHEIPIRKITTEEIQNIPDVCWELDTAATPVGLVFKVITKSKKKRHKKNKKITHAKRIQQL